MLKFNKDFNAKIVSLIVTVLFLFNSVVYGIDIPRNTPPNKLRVPVGQVYKRIEEVKTRGTGSSLKLLDFMVKNEHYKDNPISLGDIKKQFGNIAFTIRLKVLEKIGVIKSIQDSNDRRKKLYFLTTKLTLEQVGLIGKAIPELDRYSRVDLSGEKITKAMRLVMAVVMLEGLYKMLSVPASDRVLGEALFQSDGTVKYFDHLKDGKALSVISGTHYSQQALDLLHKRLFPQIIGDKEGWLFLIEGRSGFGKSDIPESVYATEMARLLEIPIDDPVIPPGTKEGIDLLASEDGIKIEDIYIATLLSMIRVVPLDYRESAIRVRVIKNFAAEWKVKRIYLEDLLSELVASLRFENVQEKKDYYSRIDRRLLEISNRLSRANFERMIAEHPDKDRILIYLGSAHEEILYEARKERAVKEAI